MIDKKYIKGSVSMFVVIFATLLITVVTVGFIKIMIKDQQQATSADLSRSAYDSAQAGVEDAKRAIANYEAICASGTSEPACVNAIEKINSLTCNDAVVGLASASIAEDEVKIKTGGDNSLNQAYTCVKIKLNTDDYIGVLGDDESKLIPLIGVGSFSSIKIEWFNQNDLKQGTSIVNVPEINESKSLLKKSDWTTTLTPNRPPVMRAQVIETNNSNFNFNDVAAGDNGVWDNTLFLYPSKTGVVDAKDFAIDLHRSSLTRNPVEVSCKQDFTLNIFSCSTELILRQPVDSGMKAYLNLRSIYKKANYRVTLLDNADAAVKFNAVQPEIDSTGRANNLFRRVSSRVELSSSNFSYPEATIDLDYDFCKVMLVTDSEYIPELGKCDPSNKTI
ncbi:MAG: hypothetical protein WCQ49_01010 [Candidatus Saccharibacteria bacterium]